jgi:hypothetical protein
MKQRSSQAFSTSTRKADLAKLTLIGNLGKEPELKITRNEKEYVAYAFVFHQAAGLDHYSGTRSQLVTSFRQITAVSNHPACLHVALI